MLSVLVSNRITKSFNRKLPLVDVFRVEKLSKVIAVFVGEEISVVSARSCFYCDFKDPFIFICS